MSKSPPAITGPDEPLAFRPLYRQVRDTLVRRIIAGTWSPGHILPSEIKLAAELHVSQGTVRKALDEMARENLLVRRQGLGTFVANRDQNGGAFNFFSLVPDEGDRVYPTSEVLSCDIFSSSAEERRRLKLGRADRVVRIQRVRAIEGRRTIHELLVLPSARFPGIAEMSLTGKMYGLYSVKFGVIVDAVHEQLKAVAATPKDAKILGLPTGSPLLRIDRLATSSDNVPVEWRCSLCVTNNLHYEVYPH